MNQTFIVDVRCNNNGCVVIKTVSIHVLLMAADS